MRDERITAARLGHHVKLQVGDLIEVLEPQAPDQAWFKGRWMARIVDIQRASVEYGMRRLVVLPIEHGEILMPNLSGAYSLFPDSVTYPDEVIYRGRYDSIRDDP